jgi:peptide/nickel transport system permease protein
MTLFILRRLVFALATLVVVSVIAFVLVHSSPTTPGVVAVGMGATATEIETYNESIGWNDPWIEQYLRWASGAIRGDFGTSLADNRDVMTDLLVKIPTTASLAAGATLISAVVGIAIGVTAAVRGRIVDRTVGVFTGIGAALPSFWLGIGLVFAFAVQLRMLPATGYVPFESNPALWLRSLILPVLTIAIGGAAFVARQTRASMREALGQEFIRTLRASGTPTWKVLYVHALRSASLPIVASIALQFIALFGGSVIIEQLFALPGLGFAAQAAVGQNDAPKVQAIVVIATVVVVVVNLVLEFVTKALDPRLRAS